MPMNYKRALNPDRVCKIYIFLASRFKGGCSTSFPRLAIGVPPTCIMAQKLKGRISLVSGIFTIVVTSFDYRPYIRNIERPEWFTVLVGRLLVNLVVIINSKRSEGWPSAMSVNVQVSMKLHCYVEFHCLSVTRNEIYLVWIIL